MARREYGTGSVYQRKDGLWIGRVDAGWTPEGKRRRRTVSAKTEAACKRRLRELITKMEAGGPVVTDTRTTVKRYADQWLEVKQTQLRPKAFNAAASPLRRWIIPTIGNKRIGDLSPAHVRQVEQAQRDAGLKGTTAAATQRTLMNMLRDARADGHHVSDAVLAAPKPKTSASDRRAMEPDELRRVLVEAGSRPGGLRWLLAVLYGWRMGETLGLRPEAVDLDAQVVRLEWQLQALPYNVPRDRKSGFRVPHEYEAIRLVDSYHLVRPKSRAGWRSAHIPSELVPVLRSAIAAVDNPYGLLFPGETGRPRNDKHDRAEWWDIQEKAGVQHPSGRPYHVHECRNAAASGLRDVGADDLSLTAILGHASVDMSRKYQGVRADAQAAVIEAAYRNISGEQPKRATVRLGSARKASLKR